MKNSTFFVYPQSGGRTDFNLIFFHVFQIPGEIVFDGKIYRMSKCLMQLIKWNYLAGIQKISKEYSLV